MALVTIKVCGFVVSEAPGTAVPNFHATHAYAPLVFGVQRQRVFGAVELSIA